MNDNAPHESLKDLIKSPKGRDIFYVIGGLASILGLYLYLHSGGQGQSVSSLSGTGTGGVSPDSTLIDQLNQQVQALKDAAKVGTNVEFKFGTDNSQALDVGGGYSDGSSGGTTFGIGGGGYSLGVGNNGSSGHTQSGELKHTNSDVFSADVVLQNASDSTIKAVQSFLTNIVGTETQRTDSVTTVANNQNAIDLSLAHAGAPF